MLSEKTSRWLGLPLLLLWATATNAVPTVSKCEGDFIIRASFLNSRLATPSAYGAEINVTGEARNSHVDGITVEFPDPLASCSYPEAP